VLDAGCGTGRVAIELSRRGFAVTGLDIDAAMLSSARAKAPDLTWVEGDLAGTALDDRFDVVVLAGNVLIFVAPGTEADVVARCAEHLRPGGLVIAGFQVQPDGYDPASFDADASAAGLALVDRWSTWDRAPWSPTDGYQVSVHRRS
jgi:SAM-dependent methyltransferase